MKGLLFTYLLTYGGAAAALVDPFRGLLVYVCFAIVRPESMWPWAVPPGNYSRIVALAMLAGWLLHGCGNLRLGPARGITLSFVGFWLWSVLGAALAEDPATGWVFVETIGKILLPFLVGITTIDSKARIKQLAWVVLASQGYVAFEMNLYYLGGYNKLYMEGFGGIDNNSAAIGMVTALGLALFLGLDAPRLWQKGLALGIALVLAHAVLFSFSRGGMLAMLVSGGVAFLLLPKRPGHCLAFAAAAVLAIQLAGPEVRERFRTSFSQGDEREASAQSRLDLWRDCWDVIQKNPVLGVGPDHWPLVAPLYGWPLGKEAHSLWVQTAAEMGIPGLLMLASFYGLCMVRLWPLARGRSGGLPAGADEPAGPDPAQWDPEAPEESHERTGSEPDPWYPLAARMVITSLAGFVVAAQFVSLEALEIPYYVTLLGAGTLNLSGRGSTLRDEGQFVLAGPAEFRRAV